MTGRSVSPLMMLRKKPPPKTVIRMGILLPKMYLPLPHFPLNEVGVRELASLCPTVFSLSISDLCVHVLADERTRVTEASFAVCSQLQQWMWDFDKARWSSLSGTDRASTRPASWDPCWLRPSGSCRYVPVSVVCLGTSAGMFLSL